MEFDIDEEEYVLSDAELVESGYTDFSQIQLITITILANLNIDLKEDDENILFKIHHLLPTYKISVVKSTRSVKKVTMIHPGIPYIICNSKYNGDVRGTVKSISKGKWPTGIMSDMTMEDKFVNFKLSKSSINITGAKSIKMGLDGAEKFTEHINNINSALTSMNERIEEARIIANEVLREGFVSKIRTFPDGLTVFKFNAGHVRHREDEDKELSFIRAFFVQCLLGINRYDQACAKMEWLLSLKAMYSDPLYVMDHYVSMTKYKFDLGFEVNLSKLFLLILENRPEFFVNYEPLTKDYVKMEIYDPEKSTNGKTRKHGFNIESSGRVTYTSGNIENSRIYYKYFITVINDYRYFIEIEQ